MEIKIDIVLFFSPIDLKAISKTLSTPLPTFNQYSIYKVTVSTRKILKDVRLKTAKPLFY